MQVLVDGAGHGVGEPGQGQKVVERGGAQSPQTAVLAQQTGPAARAEAGHAF
jgi:hypothetical protein